ncbi:hypothetical protein QCK34_004405 [Enterobacter asburiae]|nr:hypothetical protein [Enterobacter asburiae]
MLTLPKLKHATTDHLSPIVRNFKKGDLMYGLSGNPLKPDGREPYLLEVENYYFKNKNTLGNEWGYKGGVLKKGRGNRSMVINSYNDPVNTELDTKIKLKQKGWKDLDKPESRMLLVSEAIDLVSSKSYRNKEAYGFDFDSYKDIAIGTGPLAIQSKHSNNYEWWKRGSKSGIEMIARQPPGHPRKLHFILDDLDISKVALKEKRYIGGKEVPQITSSELRYIYRHWHRLKGKVIFYYKNKVSDAPWETNNNNWSTKWSVYTPKDKQR